MSEEAKRLVSELQLLPFNQRCADCLDYKPEWASINLGIFICINCSGIHRSLGTHISFVRSCTLDSWTDQQAAVMRAIGNKISNQYWESNLPPNFVRPKSDNRAKMEEFIRNKYIHRLYSNKDGKAPSEIPISQLEALSDEEIQYLIRIGKQEEDEQKAKLAKIDEDFDLFAEMDEVLTKKEGYEDLDLFDDIQEGIQEINTNPKYETYTYIPPKKDESRKKGNNTSADGFMSNVKGLLGKFVEKVNEIPSLFEHKKTEIKEIDPNTKKDESSISHTKDQLAAQIDLDFGDDDSDFDFLNDAEENDIQEEKNQKAEVVDHDLDSYKPHNTATENTDSTAPQKNLIENENEKEWDDLIGTISVKKKTVQQLEEEFDFLFENNENEGFDF